MARGTIGPDRRTQTRLRRVAGATGFGYVVASGVENMNVLQAPAVGDPGSRVLLAFADQGVAWVTFTAGVLALPLYGIFAASLLTLCRTREPGTRAWSRVGLVGAAAGVLLALAALAVTLPLTAGYGPGMAEESVGALYRLQVSLRQIAGGFTGLFVFCAAVAASRSGTIPAWTARPGMVIGVLLAPAPLAVAAQGPWAQTAVLAVFVLHVVWIFAVSLWVLPITDGTPVEAVRRSAFLVLAVAAGLVGAALIAVPGAAGAFFSWSLEPAPLAAYAGGAYVGSAAVYAAGLNRPANEARPLIAGAVVLSVSVLTITLLHLDRFDLGRLQAIAWVVLFAVFSAVTIGLAAATRRSVGESPPLTPSARTLLIVAATVLGVLAVPLWVSPQALASAWPYPLPVLGGRFAGSWVALLATVLAWAALRNRRDEARLPAVALITLPAGVLLGSVRTLADLPSYGTALGYLLPLAGLIAIGVVVLPGLSAGTDVTDAPATRG